MRWPTDSSVALVAVINVAGPETLFVVKMPQGKGRGVVVAGLDSLKQWEVGDEMVSIWPWNRHCG